MTLEKCRNFSQAAVSRNVSQPAFSRRIRALEQAIGVELFNRQVTPLQLSEQGKIFHSQIRHLLQQLESNLAELRGGSDYAQRKIKIAAAHSLSLGLLPSIISQMPPLFTWAIEAIDVDEAVNYSRNSYMGRLINRTLTRHSELSFSTFFVSSMSELLKQVALDGCGIAWLPEYAIQQEIRSGQLVVLNRDELVIPIQAYAYRMNTRMNPVAERFWRELRELEIVLS
ncbi:MAG: LysR substrate-binding domain-containing protein [Escherichia coli]|nr:LysR substrate-binding domain-containing protein [Escherichia coli]